VTATPIEVIVHAATKKEKSTQDVNVLWTEFGSNDVYRRFEVANPIDVDRVTAMLENGILRINAPETAKPMEVNAAINPVLGAGFFGVNEQEPFRNACSVELSCRAETRRREAIAATSPEQVPQSQAKLGDGLLTRPDPAFWGKVALSYLPWAPTVDSETIQVIARALLYGLHSRLGGVVWRHQDHILSKDRFRSPAQAHPGRSTSA